MLAKLEREHQGLHKMAQALPGQLCGLVWIVFCFKNPSPPPLHIHPLPQPLRVRAGSRRLEEPSEPEMDQGLVYSWLVRKGRQGLSDMCLGVSRAAKDGQR